MPLTWGVRQREAEDEQDDHPERDHVAAQQRINDRDRTDSTSTEHADPHRKPQYQQRQGRDDDMPSLAEAGSAGDARGDHSLAGSSHAARAPASRRVGERALPRPTPPPREVLGRWGLLAGQCVASAGDELVNPWSTSALTQAGLGRCRTAVSSRPWRQLAPLGALSLHGKEGVDGSSPSEGSVDSLLRQVSRPEVGGSTSRGPDDPRDVGFSDLRKEKASTL